MSQHFPGPWFVFGEDETDAGKLLPPADGRTEGSGWPYVIASEDRGPGYGRLHIARGVQGEHDARLIAAAPDLLEACMLIRLDCISALAGGWNKSDDGFRAQLALLQAAIAKAGAERC